MDSFKWITYGNENPSKKTKLWLCAHPDDIPLYLEWVSQIILHARKDADFYKNCAIWYDSEPSADYGDVFLDDLKEMRAFVIPVTRKFLTTDSRARTVELRYALESGISVLPLMMEPDLADDFNEICGNLQLLDPCETDETAISFESKLDEFLSAIIIGGKLAKQIHAEFDTQVFLSYRKMDRRHAQRLMEIIHSIDLFRDVSIWYDEYLTPGDDFNDSIVGSLEESRAFILVVTPNIVAKSRDKDGVLRENYIVSTEYPAANGKLPVVPIELVPTDRAPLCEKYCGLPEIISVYDIDLLTASLQKALERVDLRAKKGNPEHDYLIGLAYLTGTGVEVDRERGLRLIIAAAEAGNYEAMKKLSGMYSSGDGLEQDYLRSAELEEKIRESERAKYLQENEPIIAMLRRDIFINESYVLSNTYFLGNMREKGREVLEQLASFLENDTGVSERKRLKELFCIYRHLGEYAFSDASCESKNAYLLRSYHFASELVNKYPAKDSYCCLAMAYLALAEEKDMNFLFAFKEAETAISFPDIEEKDIAFVGSKYSALEIFLKCALKCAEYLESKGELDSAENCYRKVEIAVEKLIDDKADDTHFSYLIECCSKILKYKISHNDSQGAGEYYDKILRALRRATHDLPSVKGIKWMSGIYVTLIEYCFLYRNGEEAERRFSELIDIAEKQYEDRKLPENMDHIIGAYKGYIELLEKMGYNAIAKSYCKKALDYFFESQIIREGKNDDRFYFCLASTILLCSSCGFKCKEDEDRELVDECAARVLELIKLINKELIDIHKKVVINAFDSFISIYCSLERFECAEEYALTAICFLENEDLGMTQYVQQYKKRLSEIRKSSKKYEYGFSVKCSENVDEKIYSSDEMLGSPSDFDSYMHYSEAEGFVRLAETNYWSGDYSNARLYADRAYELISRLCEKHPDQELYARLRAEAQMWSDKLDIFPYPSSQNDDAPKSRGILSRLFHRKKNK